MCDTQVADMKDVSHSFQNAFDQRLQVAPSLVARSIVNFHGEFRGVGDPKYWSLHAFELMLDVGMKGRKLTDKFNKVITLHKIHMLQFHCL